MDRANREWNADIIVLTEFHEQRGPVALWSVPAPDSVQPPYSEQYVSAEGAAGPTRTLGTEALRALLSSVLSVDYRGALPAPEAFMSNTCVFAERPADGDAHLAIHFTLLDVAARGYVRPMALVYLTRSQDKLMRCHGALVAALTEVITLLKAYNRRIALRDVDDRIADMAWTEQLLLRGDAAELAAAFAPTGGKPHFNVDGLRASMRDLTDLRAQVLRLPELRIAPDIVAEHGVRLAAAVDAYAQDASREPRTVFAIYKSSFDKSLKGLSALCSDTCVAVAQQRTAAVLRAHSWPREVATLARTLCDPVLAGCPAFYCVAGGAVAGTSIVQIPADAKMIDSAGADADVRAVPLARPLFSHSGSALPPAAPVPAHGSAAATAPLLVVPQSRFGAHSQPAGPLLSSTGSPQSVPDQPYPACVSASASSSLSSATDTITGTATPDVLSPRPGTSPLAELPDPQPERGHGFTMSMTALPRVFVPQESATSGIASQPPEQEPAAGPSSSSSPPPPPPPPPAPEHSAAVFIPRGDVPQTHQTARLRQSCADNLWIAGDATPGMNTLRIAFDHELQQRYFDELVQQQNRQRRLQGVSSDESQQQQQQQQQEVVAQEEEAAVGNNEGDDERPQSATKPETAAPVPGQMGVTTATTTTTTPFPQAPLHSSQGALAHLTLQGLLVPPVGRPLVYSMLRGRPVVVRGPDAEVVRCVVNMLAVFVLGDLSVAVRPYCEGQLHLADLAEVKLVGVSLRTTQITKPVQICASILTVTESGRVAQLIAPQCPPRERYADEVLCAKRVPFDEASFVAHVHEVMGHIMTRAHMFYHMCCAGVSSFVTYPSEEGLLFAVRQQQQRRTPVKTTPTRKLFARERSNSVPVHRLPAGDGAGRDTVAALLAREMRTPEAAAQAAYSLVPVAPDVREGVVRTFLKRMHVADADRAVVEHFAQTFVTAQARFKHSLLCVPPVRYDCCESFEFVPPKGQSHRA